MAAAAVLEDRDVAALAQDDPDGILAPLVAIVLLDLVTQAPRFHADDGVDAGVEGFPPVEYFQPNEVLLKPVRLAQKALFHDELQKTANAMRLNERAATQDEIQLRTNLG